ncbi:MAG: futalosine hydrolase [Gemmatimonadota bacterium]|nr:futalosine hydrolase [Gemmatimonadota bacterium]
MPRTDAFNPVLVHPIPGPPPLALLAAVPAETRELAAALENASELRVGRKAAVRGELDGRLVLVFATGMGKTNAAHALTALLEGERVKGVIGFGIGGAYPESGLALGDVALASEAVYGDDGAETPAGWIDTEAIGIPLLQGVDGTRFNRFPLDAARVEAARTALERAGIPARVGPSVTVSRCSGTGALGREMAARWGAVCEGMEGAALAHVAALYGVPFLEVRGVSNRVEDRDPSRWRIAEAAAAAQRAVRVIAASWPP